MGAHFVDFAHLTSSKGYKLGTSHSKGYPACTHPIDVRIHKMGVQQSVPEKPPPLEPPPPEPRLQPLPPLGYSFPRRPPGTPLSSSSPIAIPTCKNSAAAFLAPAAFEPSPPGSRRPLQRSPGSSDPVKPLRRNPSKVSFSNLEILDPCPSPPSARGSAATPQKSCLKRSSSVPTSMRSMGSNERRPDREAATQHDPLASLTQAIDLAIANAEDGAGSLGALLAPMPSSRRSFRPMSRRSRSEGECHRPRPLQSRSHTRSACILSSSSRIISVHHLRRNTHVPLPFLPHSRR